MSASRIVASLSSFVLLWVVAEWSEERSAEMVGALRTVLVYFLCMQLIPLLGMTHYLVREVAVHQRESRKYFLHGLMLSCPVAVLAAAAVVFVGRYGAYSRDISNGLLVVAVGAPAAAINVVAASLLVGLGRATVFGVIQTVEVVLRTAVAVLVFVLGGGVVGMIGVFVALRWLFAAVYWIAIRSHTHGQRWSVDRAFFSHVLSHVPMFFGILALALIVRYSSQAMLPWMKDDASAGQFAVALTFLDAALILPTAFVANLMPLMSQRFHESATSFGLTCRGAVKLVTVFILPAAVLGAILARPVILGIFKEQYGPAVPLLQLVIWACFLMALDQVLSTGLIASRRQDLDLKVLAIGGAATVVLQYVLIGRMGASGAALGMLVGTLILVGVRLAFVGRYIPGLEPFRALWRPAVAAAVMTFVGFFGLGGSWLLTASLALAAYVVALMLVGGVSRAERMEMASVLAVDTQR
jgi:O-antigen/teichoic acid export membrane protein